MMAAPTRQLPRLSLVDAPGVLLGLVILGAFVFLPWLNLWGKTYTGLNCLLETPHDLEGRMSAPALIPVAAALALVFSAISFVAPRLSRVGAYLVLLSGLLSAAHFVIFFTQNSGGDSITYLAGPGFWLSFLATGGLILQVAVPRAGADLAALLGVADDEASDRVYLGVFGGKAAAVLERLAAWIGSQPKYLAVFAWLAILTLLEVTMFGMDFPLTTLALVVLSGVKVLLVAGYYMHLRDDSRIFTYIMLVPLPFVIVLVLALLFGL